MHIQITDIIRTDDAVTGLEIELLLEDEGQHTAFAYDNCALLAPHLAWGALLYFCNKASVSSPCRKLLWMQNRCESPAQDEMRLWESALAAIK